MKGCRWRDPVIVESLQGKRSIRPSSSCQPFSFLDLRRGARGRMTGPKKFRHAGPIAAPQPQSNANSLARRPAVPPTRRTEAMTLADPSIATSQTSCISPSPPQRGERKSEVNHLILRFAAHNSRRAFSPKGGRGPERSGEPFDSSQDILVEPRVEGEWKRGCAFPIVQSGRSPPPALRSRRVGGGESTHVAENL